jgi:hypothetical protein
MFHVYGDTFIANEGLTNLGLCSALRAFEKKGIITMPRLLWHRTSVFRSHLKDSIASYDTKGHVEDIFEPGSLRVPFSVTSCDTREEAEDLFLPGSPSVIKGEIDSDNVKGIIHCQNQGARAACSGMTQVRQLVKYELKIHLLTWCWNYILALQGGFC